MTRDATGRVTVLAWAPVDVTGENPQPDTHTLTLSVPLMADGTGSAGDSDPAGSAFVLREVAEPDRRHYQLPVVRGRVDLNLTLTRNEVTLMELTTVRDESPPWLNDRWILGAPAELAS